MRAKYNFHGDNENAPFVVKYKNEALPSDVNDEMKAMISQLGNIDEFTSRMDDIQNRKLFGKLLYFINDMEIIRLEYHFGVCFRLEIPYGVNFSNGDVGKTFAGIKKHLKTVSGKCEASIIFKLSKVNKIVSMKKWRGP